MTSLKDRLTRGLPWIGPLLLIIGLCSTPLLSRLPENRAAELLALSLLASGGAWLLRRALGWSFASALAVLWTVVLPVFAGVLPVLSSLLMLFSALALGGALFPRRPPALQAIIGLVLLAALLGWLVQVPVHFQWSYLLLCAALVAWRYPALRGGLPATAEQWHTAVSASPRLAAFAVMVMGLASTACWLPTLQYDDLAYHLRLPWQLLELGAYYPAPQQQIWALAPWATDVLQAMPQVMAGTEARGPVNAIWLALLATGSWQLATQLGAPARSGWLAVALVASLPLTPGLATSMQTELPSAALLVWMATVVAMPRDGRLVIWMLLAVLTGGLAASKLTAAVMAVPVLLWALARHPWPSPLRIVAVLCVGVLVGGASYAQAAWMTGNPVLPLFNGVFRSAYYAPVNFIDPLYKIGFGADLPWALTFHSSRYFESHDGAAGVVLVALAGLWGLALLRPATRVPALVATAAFIAPLLPVQYLRYAYPGMALLCVVLVVAASEGPRRSMTGLLLAVCILNIGFHATGNWMLRNGALKDTLRTGGSDAALFERFAPERTLAAAIRQSEESDGTVLVLDSKDAFFAEFGDRGRTLSWYAPTLEAAAQQAAHDTSGLQFASLLRDQQVRHVISRSSTLRPAEQAGLQHSGAVLRQETGGRQWWSLPTASSTSQASQP